MEVITTLRCNSFIGMNFAVLEFVQGDGAWLLDENGEPVRPAILWNDTRREQFRRKN